MEIYIDNGAYSIPDTNKGLYVNGINLQRQRAPTDPIFYTNLKLVSLQTGFGYRCEDKDNALNGEGEFSSSPTYINNEPAYSESDAVYVYYLKYGYKYKQSTFALTSVETLLFMAHDANSNVTLSESAAGALTGIAVNKTNKTITVTSSHTQANIYDYMQWYQSQTANTDLLPSGEVFSTILGNTYTLKSDWTLIFDVLPSGAFDVSGGKVYFNFASGTITDFNYDSVLYFDLACTLTATDCQIDSLDTVTGDETVSYTPTGTSNSPTNLDVTNITIVAEPVVLTVNSNVASSDIKVFNTGTQTIHVQATGTTVNTETAGTYDITVMKAGYLPQRQTGKVLGTTTSVTIDFVLIADPIYNASHGLAYTTDFTYNRTLKELTLNTRQAGRDFYSALIDNFISQSTLDNTPFDFQAVGIDSIFFDNGAELATGSEDNWYDAGIRYIDSGVTTAEWCSIKSSGSIPAGVTGRYQTSAGGGTTALRVSGAVNQIIQVYGDATHGNFDYRNYLVIKFQANPYVDTRSDILSLAGVSALEPFEYSVAIEPTTLDITAGTGGATLTLVDHTATPKVVGGKSFSYEIQDTGTATAEDILRTWDYSIAQTGTYQSTDTFNLPEFIAQSGSTYETRQGIVETKGATLYGCYVSRGGSDHPDFTRHQSDDGTYYVKPILANISITNIPNDGVQRLQIYNTTTATEIYNGDPANTSYSDTYTEGDVNYASDGDSIQITFAEINGAVSFKSFRTIVTATSSGFSADASNYLVTDSVYASNAVDGTLLTMFTANFGADYIEFTSDTDFTAAQAYAYFCYTLTLEIGIYDFWGGVTAIDTGNYRINQDTLNLFFDSPTGATYSVKQTDSARIFRENGTYPVKDPTTSGYGVQLNWQNVVYVQNIGGSALLPAEKAQLTAIESKTSGLTYTTPNKVDATVDLSAITTNQTSIESKIDIIDLNVDAILVDTNELQTNQSNWITATGFATASDITTALADIDTRTGDMWQLMGLDISNPVTTTTTTVDTGTLHQDITGDGITTSTLTRT